MKLPHRKSIARHALTAILVASAFVAGRNMPRGNEGNRAPVSGQPRKADLRGGAAANSSPEAICAAKDSALAAWSSALALNEGTLRDLETFKAWRHLAASDPATAWRESFRLADGAELRATLQPDAAAATAWAASAPEEFRASAIIEAASLLMKRSPRDAMQWTAQISDPDMRHDARLAIVSQWGRHDAAEAAAWCLKEPAGAELLPAVLASWAATDLMSASQWLSTQPSGATRDAAALALIEPLLELEPASALEWAQTLSDPEMRAATEQRIAAAMQ